MVRFCLSTKLELICSESGLPQTVLLVVPMHSGGLYFFWVSPLFPFPCILCSWAKYTALPKCASIAFTLSGKASDVICVLPCLVSNREARSPMKSLAACAYIFDYIEKKYIHEKTGMNNYRLLRNTQNPKGFKFEDAYTIGRALKALKVPAAKIAELIINQIDTRRKKG